MEINILAASEESDVQERTGMPEKGEGKEAAEETLLEM